MIDRSELNRALAKAIAYHECGKPEQTAKWALRLVELLEAYELFDVAWRRRYDKERC